MYFRVCVNAAGDEWAASTDLLFQFSSFLCVWSDWGGLENKFSK